MPDFDSDYAKSIDKLIKPNSSWINLCKLRREETTTKFKSRTLKMLKPINHALYQLIKRLLVKLSWIDQAPVEDPVFAT